MSDVEFSQVSSSIIHGIIIQASKAAWYMKKSHGSKLVWHEQDDF